MDKGAEIRLSAGEWAIMEKLWEKAPQTLTQLVKSVGAETGWSKSTVVTMVSRMEEKGAVRYEKGGRAKLYYPAIKRRAAAERETQSLLDRVYRGSAGLLVSALFETGGLTERDIDELSALLEEARRKKEGQ